MNEHARFVGGVERYMFDTAEELSRQGHVTDLFHARREHTDWKGGQAIAVAEVFVGENSAARRVLGQRLAGGNWDVVYVQRWAAPWTYDLMGRSIPVVRFQHDYSGYCPGGARRWRRTGEVCTLPFDAVRCSFHAFRDRCASIRPNQLLSSLRMSRETARFHHSICTTIVASWWMKRSLAGSGYPAERVFLLPYFTKVDRQTREKTRTAARKRILFVGRLVPEKGVHVLIQALAQTTAGSELSIVGEGRARSSLEALVRKLRLEDRVSFSGRLDGDALGLEYRRADLVAVPSVWPEPFGIVGIEAMAHGRAVVGSNVGGIPEWLTDAKTGWLATPGDAVHLAAVLSEALSDDEERARRGRAGFLEWRKRFQIDSHVRALLEIFRFAANAWTSAGGIGSRRTVAW